MTALLLNGAATPTSLAYGLRLLLARLGAAIDAVVSARAARTVPEWRMRQLQAEVRRHLRAVGVARKPRRRR